MTEIQSVTVKCADGTEVTCYPDRDGLAGDASVPSGEPIGGEVDKPADDPSAVSEVTPPAPGTDTVDDAPGEVPTSDEPSGEGDADQFAGSEVPPNPAGNAEQV